MGVFTLPQVTHTAATIALMAAIAPVVLAVSLYSVYAHVKDYQNPVIQRYCIRILLIVPVYVVLALCSFATPLENVWILDLMQAGYEAFTIYNFLALMLAFVGGPVQLVDLWESERRYLSGSWKATTCCLGTVRLDGLFLRRVVQSVIQFVIVRLCFAVLVPVMIRLHLYDEGKIRFNRSWVYATVIHNASMGIALYALLLFFLATRHYLRPFSPVLKFVLIKSIIFVSFWQKIALEVFIASKFISPPHGVSRERLLVDWNMFLVIIECLPLAILNYFAFGTQSAMYDVEWGSWRMLVEHGDPSQPHAFPGTTATTSAGSATPGASYAPKPLAAFSHAVNATDVLHHAYTSFSDNYGRSRYMALELSQREAASNAATPVHQARMGHSPQFLN